MVGGCDTIVEGETILRVQEIVGGDLACIYNNPKLKWWDSISILGFLTQRYRQFGFIRPKDVHKFKCEGGFPPKLGSKIKLTVIVEVIE